jgi:hypothetical protein
MALTSLSKNNLIPGKSHPDTGDQESKGVFPCKPANNISTPQILHEPQANARGSETQHSPAGKFNNILN